MRYTTIIIFCFITFCTNATPVNNKSIKLQKNLATTYNATVPNCWIEEFAKVERWVAGMRPTVTARALTYIHIGAYETVLPAMPNFISNTQKIPNFILPQFTGNVKDYNWNIALNACYAKLDSQFLIGASPEYKTHFTVLKDSINNLFKQSVSSKVYSNSVNWGLLIANAVIKFAQTDKVAEDESHNPYPKMYDNIPKGDGYWLGEKHGGYIPFTPNWGSVKTFTTFGSELLSPPPPKYSTDKNSQYYKDNLEVYNDWKNMDYEKRWRAEFWSDDIVNFTFGPSTRVIVIANQMAKQKNFNLEQILHLFCKLSIGLNDATIACWKNKYIYNTERPWQFIHKNFDTTYRSIMGEAVDMAGKNPPFPGYPSGHSVCAGVGQIILTEFFGENYLLTDYSHLGRKEFNSTPRTFTTMKEMAEENAYSRIPLGAHTRFDCAEGLRLGRSVGKNVVNYKLTNL